MLTYGKINWPVIKGNCFILINSFEMFIWIDQENHLPPGYAHFTRFFIGKSREGQAQK